MKQFRMAMRNLHMLCEIQKDSSCKTNLEDFLKSIVYILYIISNLRKLGVQCFKRCANRIWNEEVIAIWRQLHQAENEFRITFLWCEIFASLFLSCENFTSLFFTCEIFAATFLKWENFASPFPPTKFSQHHISLTKCNLQIFCTDSVRFLP